MCIYDLMSLILSLENLDAVGLQKGEWIHYLLLGYGSSMRSFHAMGYLTEIMTFSLLVVCVYELDSYFV